MTIDEAVHRILRSHWILILSCVLLPMLVALGIAAVTPAQYEAVGRIQLGGDLAASNVQADASSERALGIATSPGVVRTALESAGLSEDPVKFANDHVDVRRVGVSPVVEIAVTDSSPTRAATMARSITSDVIEFSNAGARQPEVQKIASLDTAIKQLTTQRDALIPKLAKASQGEVLSIQARLDAMQATLTEYQQQRAQLELTAATRTNAVLLDKARTPTVPLPSDAVQRAALAGLLGLLAGLGLAAARESMRPTLHDPQAIGYALDAPVIGHIPGRDTTSPGMLAATDRVADRIALLGRPHSADKVMLVPVRAKDDVWVSVLGRMLGRRDEQNAHRLECAVLEAHWVDPGEHPVAVLLSPSRIRVRDLRPAEELLASVGWPLIGIVTYDPTRRSFTADVRHRLWSRARTPEPVAQS